ncbi:MAG: hypothetical protein U0M25_03755 [Oscillospiraceae bacterium]|nr:hypothetical protein [Oscillospiraceae bacterium]
MLGPYHQLYHGSTRLFKKTFLPYLIVVTILFVVGQIGTFMALSSFSIGSMMLTLISSVLLVAASVWALVLLIFNGRTYNRKLYEQVQGRAEDIPTRLKPALILLVGYAAAMILVSALISVIGGKISTDGLTACAVTLTLIPIILVYPFIQRFMVKGITIGSVKG